MRYAAGFTAMAGLVLFAYILAAILIGLVGFYVVGFLLIMAAFVVPKNQFEDIGLGAGLVALLTSLCVVIPIIISAISAPEPAGLVDVFWTWANSPEARTLDWPTGVAPAVALLVGSWMVSGVFLIPMALENLPSSRDEFGAGYVVSVFYISAWGLTAGWFIGGVLGLITKIVTGNCPGC